MAFKMIKPLDEPTDFSIHTYLLMLFGLLTLFIIDKHLKQRALPPGPPPVPLIGNHLSLPKSSAWLHFTSLSKFYGGIYTFYNGLSPRVIISDPQIAYELLTRRSNKYSSRPRFLVFEKYARGASIIAHPYGPAWAVRRKVFHQFLNPSAIQIYKERQEAEASRLVYQISCDEGEKWGSAVMRFVSSTIFTLAYGRRIDSLDSWVLKKKLGHLAYSGMLLKPGGYLVESLPILDWLPSWIARWKIPIKEHADNLTEFDVAMVDRVREDLKKGNSKGSWTENMLKAVEEGDKDLQALSRNEAHFAGIPSTLFGAGSVTTIKTLSDVVLAMITHPWVFAAAQKEIDEVVGSSRSPTFADREKLPYIDAIISEGLRWKPVTPLGLDHATSEDDVHEGYKIPKGTAVTFNTWGMHRDETYFPSAEEFAPERYLPEGNQRFRQELKGEKKFPGKHGHSGFGWGRRICAGADLASNNMFIGLAKLIWAFELLPAEGVKYENVKFEGDFIHGVEDFKCRWKVRSEEHRKIMEEEFKAAEVVLQNFPAFE